MKVILGIVIGSAITTLVFFLYLRYKENNRKPKINVNNWQDFLINSEFNNSGKGGFFKITEKGRNVIATPTDSAYFSADLISIDGPTFCEMCVYKDNESQIFSENFEISKNNTINYLNFKVGKKLNWIDVREYPFSDMMGNWICAAFDEEDQCIYQMVPMIFDFES